jgi:hypothetical protein
LGLEFGVVLLEFGNAQFGLVVHGLPVGGAAKRLKVLGEVRTNRTRAQLGFSRRTSRRGGGGSER